MHLGGSTIRCFLLDGWQTAGRIEDRRGRALLLSRLNRKKLIYKCGFWHKRRGSYGEILMGVRYPAAWAQPPGRACAAAPKPCGEHAAEQRSFTVFSGEVFRCSIRKLSVLVARLHTKRPKAAPQSVFGLNSACRAYLSALTVRM